jgi:tubulin monoglycylase TTLL3/8
MIDENFKVWLIEVNTNPCLDTSCIILARIIPAMLENAFRIAVDPLFPRQKAKNFETLKPMENKFELVYSEFADGRSMSGSADESTEPEPCLEATQINI